MLLRTIAIGAAALVWAVPAAAQDRGTVEFGAFGSAGTFNKSLTLNSGVGGGGLVGIYLDPRWAVEFDEGEMRASRTLGLSNVNVGILSGRLVATPYRSGALSILVGAGAGGSTETNFMHSYGLNALVGAKFRINESTALRIDGISDWLANNSWKSYQSVHVGLSFYRRPNSVIRTVVRTVEIPAVAPAYVPRSDSVSAEEQARRRRVEQDYRNLRDSLSRPTAAAITPASSAAALATMEEKIHFATDKSELTPESKALLDSKVTVFRANPQMRIVILGNTDERASDAYNMALGRRRADAAKAYLVAQGIDPVRVEITSMGKRNPTASGTTGTAEALNRRDEFRLLVASDFLVPPKP
jgi:peptidoglycan-associated lipoprotein